MIFQVVCSIDKEPAASAELEINIEDRFPRCSYCLHDGIPAIHLVDDIAVDILRFIVSKDLFSLRFAGRLCRNEFKFRELFDQDGIDIPHHGAENKSLIRPVRFWLNNGMKGINDSDAQFFT